MADRKFWTWQYTTEAGTEYEFEVRGKWVDTPSSRGEAMVIDASSPPVFYVKIAQPPVEVEDTDLGRLHAKVAGELEACDQITWEPLLLVKLTAEAERDKVPGWGDGMTVAHSSLTLRVLGFERGRRLSPAAKKGEPPAEVTLFRRQLSEKEQAAGQAGKPVRRTISRHDPTRRDDKLTVAFIPDGPEVRAKLAVAARAIEELGTALEGIVGSTDVVKNLLGAIGRDVKLSLK